MDRDGEGQGYLVFLEEDYTMLSHVYTEMLIPG